MCIIHSNEINHQCFVFLQIFIVIIVNGCCKIEQKCSDLLLECHHLRVDITDDSVQNEVEIYGNFISSLPPMFTAAGVFQLDQSFYSSFSSTLVTYLIVIIQMSSFFSMLKI